MKELFRDSPVYTAVPKSKGPRFHDFTWEDVERLTIEYNLTITQAGSLLTHHTRHQIRDQWLDKHQDQLGVINREPNPTGKVMQRIVLGYISGVINLMNKELDNDMTGLPADTIFQKKHG